MLITKRSWMKPALDAQRETRNAVGTELQGRLSAHETTVSTLKQLDWSQQNADRTAELARDKIGLQGEEVAHREMLAEFYQAAILARADAIGEAAQRSDRNREKIKAGITKLGFVMPPEGESNAVVGLINFHPAVRQAEYEVEDTRNDDLHEESQRNADALAKLKTELARTRDRALAQV